MSPEAFKHLPHLRGKVTPPDQSEFRATPERLAYWDELARKIGRPPNWRLSDQELEESRRAVLGRCDSREDLWIFAYGSLMWDPAFHFEEVRLAELAGYRRRFSLKMTLARGSVEHPSLMLSLDEGTGSCTGLVFRVASHIADVETAILWRREMIVGSYRPVLLPASTPQGEIRSLALASNPAHASYVGELSLDETAAMIATGSGVIGTNLQYFEQLAEKLEQLQIEDDYIQRLLDRVHLIARA